MKFFTLSLLFFSTSVLAMSSSMTEETSHTMPMAMMSVTSDSPSTKAYTHTNQSMHEAMSIEFTGNADIDFLRGMIPHHQGAIDMAKIQQAYGNDGTVKFFTNKVIRDQTKEIRLMQLLLQTLEYEQATDTAINAAAIEANEMVNHTMHQNMMITFSDNADIDFMTGMIPHHQGAVEMAKVVLEHGNDKRVRDLATGIINAQTTEIAAMKKWLSRLKWRPYNWRS